MINHSVSRILVALSKTYIKCNKVVTGKKKITKLTLATMYGYTGFSTFAPLFIKDETPCPGKPVPM